MRKGILQTIKFIAFLAVGVVLLMFAFSNVNFTRLGADLKEAKIISKKSWKYLVEFIVAIRFAWLSEWLRRKDTEMIRLELDYMRLLIDNKNILQKAWL